MDTGVAHAANPRLLGSAMSLVHCYPTPSDLFRFTATWSPFDQAGTFITMVGFSIPPFFTGPWLIVIFLVYFAGLSIYDTNTWSTIGHLQSTEIFSWG
jgi:ABC-type dipeptide/oligopeptide/nickel transport system permease component